MKSLCAHINIWMSEQSQHSSCQPGQKSSERTILEDRAAEARLMLEETRKDGHCLFDAIAKQVIEVCLSNLNLALNLANLSIYCF